MRIRQLPTPQPGPDQVVVAVEAAAHPLAGATKEP